MKKDHKNQKRFIELRSDGLSYTKIAKELGVSKQTLINWSKELELEIKNLKAIKMDEISEEYCIAKEKRITLKGEMLIKIKDELSKRDFSEVSIPKLFDLLIKILLSLENEEIDVVFKKEELERDEILGGKTKVRREWKG